MHRSAQRLPRILAFAAVPVILAAAGCSSGSDDAGSDSGAKDAGKKGSASSSASPGAGDAASRVAKAAYAKLPEPCKAVSKKTLDDLVPKAKNKSGETGGSDDTSMRGNCSWNSLDSNGVDGSQFRWLNVSLSRFPSDAALGSGAKRAQEYYEKQVAAAKATDGAKNLAAKPATGVGGQATSIGYDLKKKEGTFKQQTVVTRAENVVVSVDYNGAGLAGDKDPKAEDLLKDAENAAKEAVASILDANGSGSGSGDSSGSTSPSSDASKKSEDKKTDDKKTDDGKTEDKKSEEKSDDKKSAEPTKSADDGKKSDDKDSAE
ncbi:DUF3558 domain-containing protein [Streptomyces tsukubensis]|uniref:DUF3558 domain-containing protein n=1 Tax=Streptomyces tsukubensis TaxID=83656 RepID=A0A1V4A8M9_9ACTN|nr:DUF3558 domain-containing protein [Streptomyces tsukubensis]OON78358.1 DUF3558 domain-containing protein [Streptomyces tsukubensis]QFR95118.1 DUF3558 domain-containing protein [Streptomyces tsukubensis]